MMVISSTRIEYSTEVILAVGLGGIGLSILLLLLPQFRGHVLPTINEKPLWEFTYTKAKRRFRTGAKSLLDSGFERSKKAFYLVTDSGPRMILSGEFASELHNNPNLSLPRAISDEFHSYIPGFEGYAHDHFPENIGVDAIRLDLKQMLDSLVTPLSIECASALQADWTDDTEWHTCNPTPTVLTMVARLTSLFRSGDELHQSADWHRLNVEFTIDSFVAAKDLDLWPKLFRPIVHWFLPSCQRVRQQVKEGYKFVSPMLEARNAKKTEALKRGEKPPRYEDTVEWLERRAKGRPYDPVMAQLIVGMAAIHPTADMLTKVIFDLCGKDELIQLLREEMIPILREGGWTQASLSKLHLLDSVLKESQRLRPISLVTMKRQALQTIMLSDGTKIPKSTTILVTNNRLWDDSLYPNPREFQGDRFLQMRQTPGQQYVAQFASASAKHMGFGYGIHACPGRFFAATAVKIALCHLLLKYDWKLVTAGPPVQPHGFALPGDPYGLISVRRRKEEIAL